MAGRNKVSQSLSEDIEEVEEEQVDTIFDVNKYKISSSTKIETLYIDGTSFEVTVKPLSWSLRNQIISKGLRWDSNGNTNFDGDSYAREC